MKSSFVFFLLLALPATVSFSQEGNLLPASPPQVEIKGTQLLKLYSGIVQQEYVLHVTLPSGYRSSSKKYPVMYLMDSQWDFTLLTSLYGQQYYDGFIPEMIIVGVTWGGTNPNPDSLRARDYTPTKEARLPQSGGASHFLSFMKNELFPYIETNYKADKTQRGLMGCSLGGLFTLYALFTEPGLFTRYIAASPAFGWDREAIYSYERQYFDKKQKADAKLYMSMGGVERGVPGFEKLARHIADRQYANLHVKTRILENTGHSGTKAEGYARGLQYIHERPALQLDVAVLNSYTGKYRTAAGSQIDIRNDGNGLAVYFGPGNKYLLFAASETELYATSEFLNIHMLKDGSRVTGFRLLRYGREEMVTKPE